MKSADHREWNDWAESAVILTSPGIGSSGPVELKITVSRQGVPTLTRTSGGQEVTVDFDTFLKAVK